MKSVCFTAYNDENIGTLCNDEDDVYAVILRQTVRHSKPQRVKVPATRGCVQNMLSNPCNPILLVPRCFDDDKNT